MYSCTDGLTVQFLRCLLASDVHPSWLNAVVPSYPHFLSSSSDKFTGRSAFFNGLQVYLQQGFLQQSFLQRVNVILQGENAILQQGFLQQGFLQNYI